MQAVDGAICRRRHHVPGDVVVPLAALLISFGLVPAHPIGAAADAFGYQSQTGSVRASGGTISLGSSSQIFPISGLGDVDQVAFVEDGDPDGTSGTPPGYYMGRGELQTTLGAFELRVAADTVTQARWDGLGDIGGQSSQAFAVANATILFDLAAPTLIAADFSQTAGRNNGPYVKVTHLDTGLALQWAYNLGGFSIPDCGALSQQECFDLYFDVAIGDPVLLPGGDYELLFDLYAFTFQPFMGPCAVGCRNAGGSVTLTAIPEPSTAGPVGMGLALLALGRRRRVATSV
jgi:hypothetical protein